MKKKEILFITKGAHAASSRYRALNYFPALRQSGWSPSHLTAHQSLLKRFQIFQKARKADIVIVVRKTYGRFFSYLLRHFSKRIVFDFDDAIFCRSNGRPSLQRYRRFQNMVRSCEQIWAGNSYLAREALHYNPSVLILPTSIDPMKYFINTDKNNDFLDLVWIGSRATKRYLESALDVLEAAAETMPWLRLKIIADFELPTKKLKTVIIPWSEKIEAEALASSHIGIAPMPQDFWTQGKCGLKVLQYMAAGLPVISSPAGVNKDIVEHGVNGFLAQNPEEWRTAIKLLSENSNLRQKMGMAGRTKVMDQYCVDATFRKMLEALDGLQ